MRFVSGYKNAQKNQNRVQKFVTKVNNGKVKVNVAVDKRRKKWYNE